MTWALVNGIAGGLSLPALGYVLVIVLHREAVKGSHRRYVTRSLARFLQWVALAGWFFMCVDNIHSGDYFWATLNVFNISWTIWEIWRFYKSDEDDWWKKTKRRVKAKLKKLSTVRIRVPQLVPMPTA